MTGRGAGAGERAVSTFGFQERSHGVVGASGVVPMGLGEVLEAPFEAHDGDGKVGQAREVAREVGGAYPASVFVIGDVAHVVEPIGSTPVWSRWRSPMSVARRCACR